VRTDEDTIGLVRRLALHHDDAMIASILNRQERTTAYGLRFTQSLVGNLRRHWGIPRFEPPAHPAAGELLSIQQAAKTLGIAASTLRRWVNDGSSPASRSRRVLLGAFASTMHCVVAS
jgi:excisionase family DNA binding protein